jgi:phenylacetate-CoA ligase
MLYNKMYNTFRSTPNFLRKFLYLVPIEYRLGGKNFIHMYNLLKESESWSIEKLKEYQKIQLQHLLTHAIKHVSFYSDIKLTSSDPFKNLEKFPIIEKDIVKNNIKKFRANNIYEKYTYHVSTGGTSGSTMEFNLDNSTFGKEWAFGMTGWRRVGFMPGDKVVSFRGAEFKSANKGIYWQDNPIYNMLEMSPFNMSEENLSKYVKKIKKFKPKYLHGYPSAISILAKYVEREVENFPPIKAVLAISENIYPGQRELIENTFNTRFFSFYGMSEKVIMAPECEYDNRYHAFPEYGITEIVDKYGNPVSKGERGELVGTGFLNYCMPFIRYRTGDYAVLSEQSCKCKRNHLILENLIGRWSQELVVDKNEALISMTALNLHSDVFSKVHRYQFHQKKFGELILKVIPKNNFSDKDKEKIFVAFHKKVGNNLQLFVEEVEKIDLTQRGKSKLLIQELEISKWM